MADLFLSCEISHEGSGEDRAGQIAASLLAEGFSVWRDDGAGEAGARSEAVEEQLGAAKAVVVIWSADAVKSDWVRSEADRARAAHKLVQSRIDGARLPMPFDQIECADLTDWAAGRETPGWRKMLGSVRELVHGAPAPAAPAPSMSAPPLPAKPSIAVLPFANLSPDKAGDYFADGMVVEIVTALSRFKSIFVIASGSSLSLKGEAIDDSSAARMLGVRYVLRGGVRTAGGRVRITVQLIDAVAGAQIWGDKFDDSLEDVFDLQDRLAVSVAGIIEPTVLDAEYRRMSTRRRENMTGYDLYLRALHLEKSVARADVFEALELLHAAIAIDDTYAATLALAAWNHSWVYTNEWSDDLPSHRAAAIELGHKALRMGPDDADVLHDVAFAWLILGEKLEDSMAMIDRATALNPGHASAWMASGWIRAFAGEPRTALEHVHRSLRLDPRSPDRGYQLHVVGLANFELRRYEDAIAALREAVHLLPAFGANHAFLGACYAHLGDLDAARRELALYAGLMPVPLSDLGYWTFRDSEHCDLFLEAVALAEAAQPARPIAEPEKAEA
jgi:adenylate cyclase